jgi:RimJ/RimL family protein N-acetyltransferase
MMLRPLLRGADFELAASWLQRKENNQWLDFGNGRQCITPMLLRIMQQRDSHLLRLYAPHTSGSAIGIVALQNVDRNMRTATLWGVAGDKSFRHRGCAHIAASWLLTLAFRELGLHSVNTWTVAHNASQRAVVRLGFRFIGRQRQCHFIDGQPYDRLLFDLLASEHRELEDAGRAVPMERSLAGAPLQASPTARSAADSWR